VLKAAKGYYGGRSKLIRTATEAVEKGLDYAFRHRRQKKREFRGLWNVRISAAAKECGTSYSRLISGLKKAGVVIDRKVLADIAVNNPNDFAAIATMVK
jgi:large subunit ribosomal protein L20